MKIDMHTHTLEGSIDGMIGIKETIEKLKNKSFGGMVVTDHNSYKGYDSLNGGDDEFVVLRGVEYDTSDAGHMLIILPSNKKYDLFTAKGMSLKDTISVVHALGGVIGAAHPYDYYKFGMLNNTGWDIEDEIFKELDFIESFNACASPTANKRALELARKHNLPHTAGSDSHVLESVGLAGTLFDADIKNEDDLIKVIKNAKHDTFQTLGEYHLSSTKVNHKHIHSIGIRMYYLWSSAVIWKNKRSRINMLKSRLGLQV